MKDLHVHLKLLIQLKPTSCCSPRGFYFSCFSLLAHTNEERRFFFTPRYEFQLTFPTSWHGLPHLESVHIPVAQAEIWEEPSVFPFPQKENKELCLAAPALRVLGALHARLPSASMKMNSSCQQLSPELPREQ